MEAEEWILWCLALGWVIYLSVAFMIIEGLKPVKSDTLNKIFYLRALHPMVLMAVLLAVLAFELSTLHVLWFFPLWHYFGFKRIGTSYSLTTCREKLAVHFSESLIWGDSLFDKSIFIFGNLIFVCAWLALSLVVALILVVLFALPFLLVKGEEAAFIFLFCIVAIPVSWVLFFGIAYLIMRTKDSIVNMRNRKQKTPSPDSLRQNSKDPIIEAQKHDLKNLLTEGLTRAERLIVVLYYYEEMTFREIAKVLELSESKVSQMHDSIITRLKAQMNVRR